MEESGKNTKKVYRKRIPYGMMNFEDVRKEGCYYVDKTPYIEEVEASNKFFFYIRPRRFGKSLTISMLRNYYDVNKEAQFEQLFGELYIGKHPTPERNKYLVLWLDFSAVAAGIDDYKDGLDSNCNISYNSFCDTYQSVLPKNIKEEMNKLDGCVSQLLYLCDECNKAGQQIYLFIDEYDHFTNKILGEPQHMANYRKQTHGEGYLRLFFDAVKSATATSLKRVFVTGVSPVTMDDLTSGFNIGTNYSLSAEFNEMTGFTEEEVRAMLTYYSTVCPFRHSVDELIKTMKPFYDNYCFALKSYGRVTMYNSVMVLYFIDQYINNDCEIPADMIEENIRIDYNKLRMLIRHDKEFANDARVIQRLVTQGFITGTLKKGFPAESINDPDNFISLLFYFGMITIAGTYRGKTKFVIPNEVVREQIYAYLLSTYKENELTYDNYEKSELESGLAYDGDYQSYFHYIADTIRQYSSQRDKQKGESYVHGFTLTMTCQNMFYRPISELDNQGGYADIFLRPLVENYPDMEHSYIVELKYCKADATDEQVAKLKEDAIAQVNRYADTEVVQTDVKNTRLHKLVVIFRSVDMVVCEEIE